MAGEGYIGGEETSDAIFVQWALKGGGVYTLYESRHVLAVHARAPEEALVYLS